MHYLINNSNCFSFQKWININQESLKLLNRLSFSFRRHYTTKDLFERIEELNKKFHNMNNKIFYNSLSHCLLSHFLKHNINISQKLCYSSLFDKEKFLSIIPSYIFGKIPILEFENFINKSLFFDKEDFIALFSITPFKSLFLENNNLFYLNSNLILDFNKKQIFFQYICSSIYKEKKIEIFPKKIFLNDYYKDMDKIRYNNYKISFFGIKYFLINYRHFTNKNLLLLHKDFNVFFFVKKDYVFFLLNFTNKNLEI